MSCMLHVYASCVFKNFFISSNNCLKLPSALPDPSEEEIKKSCMLHVCASCVLKLFFLTIVLTTFQKKERKLKK